jgi:alpha-L-fucosidase
MISFICLLVAFSPLFGQRHLLNLNKPERETWFTELGFGMFIHWSYDVELGMVISHSMVGASADYLERYIHDLPQYFNPKDFHPEEWAEIAKKAGMKYVVFTTKHHNGFCMYDTRTTSYNIMNTPFGRDATQEVIEAFRKEGIAIGIYFSPDDFHWLHKHGILVSRARPESLPGNNPELMDYLRTQMRELMTHYGPIDIVFIDGRISSSNSEIAKVCWEVNPDVVVTRGAMETPEQHLPDQPLPSPWEACFTAGDQWQYRPTNENYKTARKVIEMVIETRAKGGNLLLNVGPTPEGEIPPEQAGILNEVALWMFINKESMEHIEPWHVIREGDIWFTRKKGENTVFAYITSPLRWKLGDTTTVVLQSVQSTDETTISLLGHAGKVLEYRPDVDPAPLFVQTQEGLKITVTMAHRIYNDRKWPNPIVVKLENVVFDDSGAALE